MSDINADLTVRCRCQIQMSLYISRVGIARSKYLCWGFLTIVFLNESVFLRFWKVRNGLEISGRLRGIISTYFRLYQSPWWRVMTHPPQQFSRLLTPRLLKFECVLKHMPFFFYCFRFLICSLVFLHFSFDFHKGRICPNTLQISQTPAK